MERRDVLKALATLPSVPVVQALDVSKPGTCIVITYDMRLAPVHIRQIEEKLEHAFPGVRCVVLDNGAKVQAVTTGAK